MTQRRLAAQSASAVQPAKHTRKKEVSRPRHSSGFEQSSAPSQMRVPLGSLTTFGAPSAPASPAAASPLAPALAASACAPPAAGVPASAASPPAVTEPPSSEPAAGTVDAPASPPPADMLGVVCAPPFELGSTAAPEPALASFLVASPPQATKASAIH